MCAVLSAQMVKLQISEVVREGMWEKFVLKICLISCMKNTGKNCPLVSKYTDQNTICFNCCPLTLDTMQAAGQINA